VHFQPCSNYPAHRSQEYISKAPWYLDTGAPSLAHQRRPDYDDSASKLNEWYDRGAKAGPAATKYRKGACENCGAKTHKRIDCLERPRKKGAKFTNEDIAADEVIQDIQAGYDAKRDRWNGYDPAEHSKIYDEHAAIEQARQKLREEQIDSQTDAAVRKVAKAGGGGGGDEFGSSDEEDADEDKYADAADAVGQKLDAKTRITVRNLRIREDTAKYLINLDPTSAYYDPKTRSMRDNPNKNMRPEDVSTSPTILQTFIEAGLRQSLLVTTSCVTRVTRQTSKNFSCSRGSLPLVVTMFISMRTLHKARSYISNSRKRRTSSRRRAKLGYWPGMVERSISRKRPRSYLLARPRIMSSTPALDK
jgi:hypothetical protein